MVILILVSETATHANMQTDSLTVADVARVVSGGVADVHGGEDRTVRYEWRRSIADQRAQVPLGLTCLSPIESRWLGHRPTALPCRGRACFSLNDVRAWHMLLERVRQLFDVEVPVLVHPLAQQDKGSGIAMICTFGDVTDIIWWRELDLPNRTIIGQDGRVIADAPDVLTTDAARTAYAELAGKTVFSGKAQ